MQYMITIMMPSYFYYPSILLAGKLRHFRNTLTAASNALHLQVCVLQQGLALFQEFTY